MFLQIIYYARNYLDYILIWIGNHWQYVCNVPI